jgi:hypothetical protein
MPHSPSDTWPDKLVPFMDVLAMRLRRLLESEAKEIVAAARTAELARPRPREDVMDLLDRTDQIVAGTAEVWPRADHFGSPPIREGYDQIRAAVGRELQGLLDEATAAVERARRDNRDRADVLWLLDGWTRMIDGTRAMWPGAGGPDGISIDGVTDWP